jgi:radical SAM protein with 4Fe4S-binding SPASM domain
MAAEIVWTRNTDTRKRVVVGEIILLNIRNKRLLILNEQAAAVWDNLANQNRQQERDIVEELHKDYPDTAVEHLRTDVHKFLCDLWQKGFVHQEGEATIKLESDDNEQTFPSGHLSFSERLHQYAAQRNIPISGGLELIQRCHLKCTHCYIDNHPISSRSELSTKEICALLEQISKQGCLWLLITGGEPLLRKDFTEVYKYAKELGMIITIFTSATNLTAQVADVFVKYPPFLIEATLHGVTATTFDVISGIPGSFFQFKRGIQLLRERNISFHLKMIVMRQNLHEVESARQLALELGAGDFRFDPMINADFFHSSKAENLRISIEEAIRLDLSEPYRSRWKKVYHKALKTRALYRPSGELLFPCRAGKCSFTISADGQLLPCILMRTPTYDLRKISFSEAWEKLNNYTTTVRMKETNSCLVCPVQTCSRCPAWGYLEHGDPDVKSRFACTLQQERENIFLSATNYLKEVES